MNEYLKRFKEWFSVEDEGGSISSHGLDGLADSSFTVFMAEIPDGNWYRDDLLKSVVQAWENRDEDLPPWQEWLMRGLKAKKVKLRWQEYDLTQTVERPNRWKHKENTTTKKLVPGDVVCPNLKPRKYLYGYDVSPALHTAEQIFKTKPTLLMPNIPIPAMMISPDGSCALFLYPIVGDEESMPHLYVLRKYKASFSDFFQQ